MPAAPSPRRATRHEENVIGGPGAFVLQVENFGSFAEAITRKLLTEIAGSPPHPQTASVR
jgi:hypothetical protein